MLCSSLSLIEKLGGGLVIPAVNITVDLIEHITVLENCVQIIRQIHYVTEKPKLQCFQITKKQYQNCIR